jgi:hypothetical protein
MLQNQILEMLLLTGRVRVGFTKYESARNGVSNSPPITGISITNKIIKIAGRPTKTTINKIQKILSSNDLINSLSLNFGAITDIYRSASTGQ